MSVRSDRSEWQIQGVLIRLLENVRRGVRTMGARGAMRMATGRMALRERATAAIVTGRIGCLKI